MKHCKKLYLFSVMLGTISCASSGVSTSNDSNGPVDVLSTTIESNNSESISISEPTPAFHNLIANKDAEINISENKAGEVRVNDAVFSISGAKRIGNNLVNLENMGLLAVNCDMGEIISITINYNHTAGSIILYYGDTFLSGANYIDSIISNEKITLNTKFFVIKSLYDECVIESIAIEYYASRINDITNSLPEFYIDTSSKPINNKIDYVSAVFEITNVEKKYEVSKTAGGIRRKGNAAVAVGASVTKHSYRIQFDKKISLFGLKAAKTWALITDVFDKSGMHNYVALNAAHSFKSFRFTVTPNPVIVYLNGKCRGIYMLTEQIQENEGRLNIEQNISIANENIDELNFYLCKDEHAKRESLEHEGRDYFLVQEESNQAYSLKYPKYEDFVEFGISDDIFYEFFDSVKKYTTNLYSVFSSRDSETIESIADVDSLTDFAILDSIFNASDHNVNSFYLVKLADGLVTFGPPWDYDLWCAGVYHSNRDYPVDPAINGQYDANPFRTDYLSNYFATSSGKLRIGVKYAEYGKQLFQEIIDDYWKMYDNIAVGLRFNTEIYHDNDIKYAFQSNLYFYEWLNLRQGYLDNYYKNI